MTKSLAYHTPDPRWQSFGCEDFDSYASKYIIQAKFHSKVDEEVVEDFKTVEYLLAHAYYYYPLIDEALNKMLRILEMAIKKRAESYGIELKKRTGDRPLQKIVNELDGLEPDKNLKRNYNLAIKLRNTLMHPKQSQLFGTTGFAAMYQLVNVLNEMFLDNNYFIERRKVLNSTSKKLKKFKTARILKKEKENQYSMHHGIHPLSVDLINGEWIHFWALHSHSKNLPKMISQNPLPKPNIMPVKNFRFGKNELIIQTLDDEEIHFKLSIDKAQDVMFELFEKEIEKIDELEFKRHLHATEVFLSHKLIKTRYEYCWS